MINCITEESTLGIHINNMNNGAFLRRLFENRFRSKKVIRRILDKENGERNKRDWPEYLTGTFRGTFYRVKVPPKKKILPDIPRLPPIQKPPIPFKSIRKEPTSSGSESLAETKRRLRLWWKENWPVLVLNIGSICTLVGFTRSDVLELRSLSVMGSISGMIFNLTLRPIRLTPILWSMTFASVNALKIYDILRERHSNVHLNAEQQDIYVNHFLPHGVTPKQFEAIYKSAATILLKKGDCLVRQGDKLDFVYLIVKGSTRASILGRHLTAASTTPTAHTERAGGASGAWVGEMSFLECYWIKEQGKHVSEDSNTLQGIKPMASNAESVATQSGQVKSVAKTGPLPSTVDNVNNPLNVKDQPVKLKANRAMYTIVAKEECTVLRWSHSDLDALMGRSTDLRGALTRAMTSAIVGKVINFTVSRSTSLPTWSTWLDDWKLSGSAQVHVLSHNSDVDALAKDEGDGEEPLPVHPIRKFNVDVT